MTEKLRFFIEDLFKDAPKTKRAIELKEEIYQNLTDKYNDLISEGKTPEAAYNISVASVGDISTLIEDLEREANMSGESTENTEAKKRSALLVSVAVMFYIISVVPVIIFGELGYGLIGVVMMFLLIAAATGLIIYNAMTKPVYKKKDETITEEFKEWQREKDSRRAVKGAIESVLWCLIVTAYFIISFSSGRWDITWIIFLIGASINGIIDAIFALTKK
ncbi:MAG: hypothetical protein IJZ89_02595 [Clostridia bacterium]|nr:hypothetical protein [Clostridia bacterium]